MTKSETETFKGYAQRWREVAAQVEPPLSDKEMLAMFISTVEHPFYKHMIGNVSSNFADIVIIRERIEGGIKKEKLTGILPLNSHMLPMYLPFFTLRHINQEPFLTPNRIGNLNPNPLITLTKSVTKMLLI